MFEFRLRAVSTAIVASLASVTLAAPLTPVIPTGQYASLIFQAQAAAFADPSYQAKLRLHSKLFNFAGNPTPEGGSALNLSPVVSAERSAYFDTPDRHITNAGWSIRLRHKTGSTDYGLTYKYRQKVDENSLPKSTIEKGLEVARHANFDSSDNNYDPQVNASFYTSTPDFNNKKLRSCLVNACAFPAEEAGVALGSFSLGMSDMEIASLNGTYGVEVSEEESFRKDAWDKRDALIAELMAMGYLLPADAFKTSFVLSGGFL